MVNNFITLHLERGDTLFFAFLDKEISGAKGQAKKILEKIQRGELPSPTGKYNDETLVLVKFIQKYLKFYEGESFAEGDTPGSKFKEAMDKFNAYLKTGKINENGIVDAQTLGAIAIYYGLAKGKTIEIPTTTGRRTIIDGLVPPTEEREERRGMTPDFPIY